MEATDTQRPAVCCPYCEQAAVLVTGAAVYPSRRDLHNRRFWRCVPCNAYVGCHPGTLEPLGQLADANLRAARIRAHDAFDVLWKPKRHLRSAAYAWLAGALGLPGDQCHIGHFDAAMCQRVVDAVTAFKRELRRKGDREARMRSAKLVERYL